MSAIKIKIITLLMAAVSAVTCTACADRADESQGVPPAEDNQSTEDKQSTEENQNEEATIMYITIGGQSLSAELSGTRAAKALAARLEEGDITYTAADYGGFEKVGEPISALPADDEWTTTGTGDIMLYSGDKIVIFYGENSWQYTRLGKISGSTADELRTFLRAGAGDVEITLSKNK